MAKIEKTVHIQNLGNFALKYFLSHNLEYIII